MQSIHVKGFQTLCVVLLVASLSGCGAPSSSARGAVETPPSGITDDTHHSTPDNGTHENNGNSENSENSGNTTENTPSSGMQGNGNSTSTGGTTQENQNSSHTGTNGNSEDTTENTPNSGMQGNGNSTSTGGTTSGGSTQENSSDTNTSQNSDNTTDNSTHDTNDTNTHGNSEENTTTPTDTNSSGTPHNGEGTTTDNNTSSSGNTTSESNGTVVPYSYIPQDADLTDRMAVRFLNIATFGATPERVKSLRQKGVVAWVNEQLDMPWNPKKESVLYKTIYTVLESGPYQYAGVGPTDNSFPYDQIDAKTQEYIADNDVIFQKHRVNLDVIEYHSSALFGGQLDDEAQLRQKVAYVLSQIIVAGESRDQFFFWRGEAISYYYDILLKHAFDHYGDILYEVSLSPAMAIYLTYANNPKTHTNDDGITITPDENYGREIMQLFSIGPVALTMDGHVVEQNRRRVPTYTQADVNEMSRVFTGLHFPHTTFGADLVEGNGDSIHPMVCDMSQHEQGSKTVLGKTITGGTCQEEIKQAVDILMAHPNVAPFVATKLIKRLTKSNPNSEYIARVATVFKNSGGDLKQTIKAVLLDKEIWNDIKTDTIVRLKEPYVAYLNFLKAFHVQPLQYYKNKGTHRKVTGTYRMVQKYDVFGQWPTWAPSVFNFYDEGFIPDDAEFRIRHYASPESQIMTAKYIINTANFIEKILNYNEWNRWLYRANYNPTQIYEDWSGLSWWDPFLRIDLNDQLDIYRKALGGSLRGYANDGNERKRRYTGALETLISDLEMRLIGKRLEPQFRQALLDAFKDDWVGVGNYTERELAATISQRIGKIVAQIVRSEDFMSN